MVLCVPEYEKQASLALPCTQLSLLLTECLPHPVLPSFPATPSPFFQFFIEKIERKGEQLYS